MDVQIVQGKFVNQKLKLGQLIKFKSNAAVLQNALNCQGSIRMENKTKEDNGISANSKFVLTVDVEGQCGLQLGACSHGSVPDDTLKDSTVVHFVRFEGECGCHPAVQITLH